MVAKRGHEPPNPNSDEMIHPSGSQPPDTESDRLPLLRLVRGLVNDGMNLVRLEVRMARLEVGERLQRFALDASLSATGAAIVVIGVLVFVEFLVIGLGVLLDGRYWLSSLIVGLVLIAVGAGIAWMGVRRFAGGTDASGADDRE